MLWLELQLFPPHLNFTLISTYPCEFASQSPDFSDPTFKKLLDQQSIRLTFSSVLYTSEILFLQSTRSQSKFGLHSLVLQPCPVQREPAIASQVTLVVSSPRQGTTQTPEIHYQLWEKRKKPCSLVPRPSAFRETLCCQLQPSAVVLLGFLLLLS